MRRTTTSLVILADMLCKEMECVTIVTRMPETKKELLARQLVEPSHRRAILCMVLPSWKCSTNIQSRACVHSLTPQTTFGPYAGLIQMK